MMLREPRSAELFTPPRCRRARFRSEPRPFRVSTPRCTLQRPSCAQSFAVAECSGPPAHGNPCFQDSARRVKLRSHRPPADANWSRILIALDEETHPCLQAPAKTLLRTRDCGPARRPPTYRRNAPVLLASSSRFLLNPGSRSTLSSLGVSSSHSLAPRVNPLRTSQAQWLLWSAALAFLIALTLFPVSYRITRLVTVVLSCILWFGLIALVWQRPLLRFLLLAITALTATFLALPSRGIPSAAALRADYIAGLQRYDGVTYYWGGESSLGIDCSGLIRRGLIDALLRRGVRTLDPGLVREAIGLWWNDCTASALGEQHRGLTVRLLDTPSVNELDHSRVLPGDLAVTHNGVHIMAYLGERRWIEADPMAGKVITLAAPTHDNEWFRTPMTIVRWRILQ